MLVVDDILLFPFRSIFWILQQVHRAAQEELSNETERISDELRNLYMELETGRITEEEFGVRERELLDRLDSLETESDLETADEEEETEQDVDKDVEPGDMGRR